MDFIEKWFGIAPDGGNGMLEASILVCIAALVIAGVVARSRRSRRLQTMKRPTDKANS